MKTSVLLFSMLALLLSGCGRTVVKESKETVREQPVITQERQVIIEKQAPALRDCTYSATIYSHGSLSCQSGYQYSCNDGTWDGRNIRC
jgi:hypothetical protein